MRNCNQVRVEYNPYQQKIQYQWGLAGTSDWQSIEAASKLENGSKYKNAALQSVLSDVIEIINREFNYDESLEVVFCGTETDFDDFNDAALQCSPPLKVVRDQTTEYLPAPKVVWQIDQIFESLKDDFAEQDSRDIQMTLEKYFDTTASVIPVCVVGTYSAGKSTFINALIGAEILPSKSEPTTAKVFKISHGNTAQVLFKYKEKDVSITFENNSAKIYVSSAPPVELSDLFARISSETSDCTSELVAETIAAVNSFEDGDAIRLVEVIVPFHKSTLVKNENIRFEIYDTPGSDAASHPEHKDILAEALKNRTNGLPIIVTDMESIEKTGTSELYNLLNRAAPMLDQKNAVIVVNKADRQAIGSIKAQSKKLSSRISKDCNCFVFLSAALSLGCKKECLPWKDDDCRKTYKNAKEAFSDYADEDYMPLPQCNVLPRSRFEHILKEAQAAEEEVRCSDGNEDAKRELIAHNSGIHGVESEIAYFAEHFAPYNKCRMAITYLSEAIGQTQEKIKDKMEEQESLEKSLECKRAERYDDITTKMNDESVTFKNDASRKAPGYLQQHDPRQTIEKEAIGNIRDAYSLYKKDPYKTRLKEAVRKYFEEAKKKYAECIKENLKTFWKEREAAFRDQIIRVITDAQSISEEEKKLLEAVVRANPPVDPPEKRVSLKGFKPKKFLWVIEYGEKVDIEKCVEGFGKELRELCHGLSNDARGKYEENAKKWINELLKVIEENLDNFNEELRTISNQIKDARGEILRLQEQASKLGDASESIQRLMSVQTRGENCT